MEPSPPANPDLSDSPPPQSSSGTRVILTFVVIAEVAAAVLFRILSSGHLEQSAALFIGIPALLALILIHTPSAKSTTGLIFKALTLAMLMAGPVLQEGYICVLISAPLFYAIAGLIVFLDKSIRKKRNPKVLSIMILYVPFFAMSLEGTLPELTIRDTRNVVAEQILPFSSQEILAQLSKPFVFTAPLPALLNIGFPRPLASTGEGIGVGAIRKIHFSPGEGRPAGDLVLQVVEATPHFLRFRALSDSSHIKHWLEWKASELRLTPMPDGTTKITWAIQYRRSLSPSWYFNPIEDFFVTRAARYLITSLAVPRV